jgi:PIN domain nuclease of toxin-antitoxin system
VGSGHKVSRRETAATGSSRHLRPASNGPDQGLRPLPITHQHALAVSGLALHHYDPFDRLLVAQAKLEDMVLITADLMIKKYPVRLLWAGK